MEITDPDRSLDEPGDDEAVPQQPSVFDHALVHEEIRRQAMEADLDRQALEDERLQEEIDLDDLGREALEAEERERRETEAEL